MVNTHSKMLRGNTKIRKWLTNNGYTNIFFFIHNRVAKGYLAGGYEFDGMCYDNEKPRLVLFQCKASKKKYKLPKKTLIAYKQISSEIGVRCLWFNAVDRQKEVDVYE